MCLSVLRYVRFLYFQLDTLERTSSVIISMGGGGRNTMLHRIIGSTLLVDFLARTNSAVLYYYVEITVSMQTCHVAHE